ncbi:MAG: hypothetical protein CMC14_01245 [Flavobacteriaceae bacterium]|nr:hypothetical protein [Flavobacteriaceae bacterium]|tara:strand:- start:23644 stop:24429 length:786 start_codon:yes stop_codon:yes gene_type:complete
MAPIKFEENIREKLQERELTPSKEAWAKLSAKLDTQAPQKRNNTFIWFAVAASFVGILLVTTLFFSKEKVNTQLVNETPIEVLDANEQFQNEGGIASENISEEKDNEIPAEKIEEAQLPKSNIAKTEKNPASIKKETITPLIEIQNQNKEVIALNEAKTEKEPTKEELFINKKVDEVVIAVQKIQNENNTVTPDEIDALLAKAQRDISNNRILQANTQKVDAAALLLDVETELERSFRDRVFDALGEGFNKVRSAVAERNN